MLQRSVDPSTCGLLALGGWISPFGFLDSKDSDDSLAVDNLSIILGVLGEGRRKGR